MNKEKMREKYEQYAENKVQQISIQLSNHMRQELIELQKLYPKRRLLFQDIMGSVTINIEMFHHIPSHTREHNGRIWLIVNWAPMQYGDMFDEHLELIDWYNGQSDIFKICIEQIIVGPTRPLEGRT